jgi:hypothetical protein
MILAIADEEIADQTDGILRGGEADALRRGREAGKRARRSEAIFAADEGVQTFEGQGQVRAAFVISDGVDFIDDDGADVAQIVAALVRREQDVERFRRGDDDVRRTLEHEPALGLQRVPGADGSADAGAEIAAFEGQLLDLC